MNSHFACRCLVSLFTMLLFVQTAQGADPAKPAAPADKAAPAAAPAPVSKPAAAPPAAAKPEVKPAETKPAAKPAESKPAAAKPAAPKGPTQVSFSKQIAPILVKQCAGCHGSTEPKGDYQLHTFDVLLKAGESGDPAVTVGDAAKSELYRLIASTDAEERMPREADPLPANQVALVKLWIEQGARFDGPDKLAPIASLIPKKVHPAPPAAYRVTLPITALAWRPDGAELAVGGYHEVTIWDPATGKLLRRVKGLEERTYSLGYTPDGKLLAAGGGTPGQSGEAVLIDPDKATVIKSLGTMSDVCLGVAFDPPGKRLAACGADRAIRIYDIASGKQDRLIEDHADWVMGIAWSPDGSQLVSGGRDKASKVFDLKTGESITTYPGHGETVYSAAFTPDGKQVLTSGADKRIHVWNPADGKLVAPITGFGGEVYKVQVREAFVFACSADKTAREFKLADRAAVYTFSGHKDYVYALDFNPATKRLATGSFDGEVRIWNTADGKLLSSFIAAPGYAVATK